MIELLNAFDEQSFGIQELLKTFTEAPQVGEMKSRHTLRIRHEP